MHQKSKRHHCPSIIAMWVTATWLATIALVALPAAAAANDDATPAQVAAAEGAAEGAASDGPLHLDGDFSSAVVMDADTGWILIANDPHRQRQPASMLKMMTELIILEHVEKGYVAYDDTVIVSARASRMGGSQVYLKHGEVFTVEELLSALAIHSANDAAVSLAEHVAGSVEAFIDLMNLRAQELSMAETTFHSVHGLPAGRGQQPDMTTAHDMAVLGRELVRYDHARIWASTATAPFRDGEFIMYNPNKLVGKYRGLDGIKTGYHGQAGFCITASAVQRDKRLISVVMGCSSDRARATETTRLLTHGFNLYAEVPVIEQAKEPLPDPLGVSDGKQADVAIGYGASLSVTVPKHRSDEIELRRELPDKVPAPVAAGDEVGSATVYLDDVALGTVPIVALEAVERGNWLDRLFR